eukprot:SAG11_NODE_1045_length_6044_cov_12.936249_4_plen_505_part_01
MYRSSDVGGTAVPATMAGEMRNQEPIIPDFVYGSSSDSVSLENMERMGGQSRGLPSIEKGERPAFARDDQESSLLGQKVCLTDGEWVEMVREEVDREESVPRQVSTPTAVPFAHIAIDKMHPPTADGGYDGILVVVDHATRFTILIPHKSTYTARENAQLLYKHVFSVFGIPESIRSDSERALIGEAFARLSEVMHIEQIVSSALNKTSNGMAERRIRFVNTLLKSVMEDKESRSWVEVLPMIQSVANGYPHPASGITSEQALFGFQPRRPSDLIHANVKSLPEGMLRNNFETNQRLLDELRASMLDQHQAAAEEMAARMAVRYRDLPESWGMDDRTWYVYLNTDAFTDNRFDKAGVRNKHYKSPGAGPYEVSQIFEDKIHFSLVLPEKMKNRYKNLFNVKSIKAFSDELEEPRELLDAVVDDINDAPLDAVNDSSVGMPGMPSDQHGVERLLERVYNPVKAYYEYLVKWTGYPVDDASWEPEANLRVNASGAVDDYDLNHPRGA